MNETIYQGMNILFSFCSLYVCVVFFLWVCFVYCLIFFSSFFKNNFKFTCVSSYLFNFNLFLLLFFCGAGVGGGGIDGCVSFLFSFYRYFQIKIPQTSAYDLLYIIHLGSYQIAKRLNNSSHIKKELA